MEVRNIKTKTPEMGLEFTEVKREYSDDEEWRVKYSGMLRRGARSPKSVQRKLAGHGAGEMVL